MCDPVSIASFALAGGSIGANMIGMSQQDAERNRVMQAENERQFNLQNKSTDLFNKSLQKVEQPTTDAAVAKEADERTAADSALIDRGGNYKPVTGSAPVEVGQSIARATKRALDRNKNQARLNANVSAYGGVNQKNMIDLGHDAQWQGLFGDAMQRSAALLPGELEQANRAGSGARGIGQVLSAASSATGAAGLSNPTGWSDLFGSGGGAIVGTSPAATAAPHGAAQAPGLFRRWFA